MGWPCWHWATLPKFCWNICMNISGGWNMSSLIEWAGMVSKWALWDRTTWRRKGIAEQEARRHLIPGDCGRESHVSVQCRDGPDQVKQTKKSERSPGMKNPRRTWKNAHQRENHLRNVPSPEECIYDLFCLTSALQISSGSGTSSNTDMRTLLRRKKAQSIEKQKSTMSLPSRPSARQPELEKRKTSDIESSSVCTIILDLATLIYSLRLGLFLKRDVRIC